MYKTNPHEEFTLGIYRFEINLAELINLYLLNAARLNFQNLKTNEVLKSRIFKSQDTVCSSLYDPEFWIVYSNKSITNLYDCSLTKKILNKAYTKLYYAMSNETSLAHITQEGH